MRQGRSIGIRVLVIGLALLIGIVISPFRIFLQSCDLDLNFHLAIAAAIALALLLFVLVRRSPRERRMYAPDRDPKGAHTQMHWSRLLLIGVAIILFLWAAGWFVLIQAGKGMVSSASPSPSDAARSGGAVLTPGSSIGQPNGPLWHAMPPLDTAALLAQVHLLDSLAVPWRPDTSRMMLWQKRLHAITVHYVAPACVCPDFELEDSASIGAKAVYLVPVDSGAAIPWRMYVSGNRYTVLGQRSVEMDDRPVGGEEPLMPGYVFRYYSYRILRPYEVWGPDVFDAMTDTSAKEDPWAPTVLMVR